MTKEIPFEVDCRDVVTSNYCTVRNMLTGQEFSAPVKEWHWRNSFCADVTFIFRGQEFTVLAEVHPEINN